MVHSLHCLSYRLLRACNSLLVEISAPPSTAGIPPPGCTDAPTRYSQGLLRSEYWGWWKGPLRQK